MQTSLDLILLERLWLAIQSRVRETGSRANDFEIIRTILSKVKHHVIAEGNINTPEKARRVVELGCYSVVVGSIITRPQLITKIFYRRNEKSREINHKGIPHCSLLE